jgi:hypothetical protein
VTSPKPYLAAPYYASVDLAPEEAVDRAVTQKLVHVFGAKISEPSILRCAPRHRRNRTGYGTAARTRRKPARMGVPDPRRGFPPPRSRGKRTDPARSFEGICLQERRGQEQIA